MSKVNVEKCLAHKFTNTEYYLTEKDVSLYSLSVGAGHKELKFVYEQSSEFQALPTIGVIFPYPILLQVIDGIDGLEYNPMMLLHGEHHLEVKNKIPTSGKLTTTSKVSGLYDKVKGVLLVVQADTSDQNGQLIFSNKISLFIRGIGGFGGDKGPKEKPFVIPKRSCDAQSSFTTTEDQALIYRLSSGDLNPLHADPEMAKQGNFSKPILHGLCSLGIASKAVLEHFCNNNSDQFKSVQVRFSKPVFPGETIITQMWLINPTLVHFIAIVKERNETVLSGGIVEIAPFKKSTL
ncbi:hypothetical protein DLAC_11509 [Tieghemostelium lacteum]|uniref:Uncharacterized protein n=1 Tax=Tieghemostelium lacteum TaxID=361077 RepID=A0A152A4Y9_TIELA|nr:hypothetical protein DLAC_11509 [Tieghemostelium lacteum]|eukprot:KYR01300.1 hypothetical protein DLAC_11509 [Tieghemostelium lacteum]